MGVPLLFTEEFEVVIMIRCWGSKRRMGRIETSDLKPITSEPMVGKAKQKAKVLNENEKALFSECMQRCAKKRD